MIGEYIFIAGVEGQVACLSVNTGGVIWVKTLLKFQNERKKTGRITYSGPIVASNRVVVLSSEGALTALSPQNGEEVARLELRQDELLDAYNER